MRSVAQAVEQRERELSQFRATEAARMEAWGGALAGSMPAPWRARVLADWRQRRADGEREGNTWLRELVSEMQEGCAVGLGLDASDEDIRDAGRRLAADAFQVAAEMHVKTLPALRERLAALADRNGVEAPAARIADQGAIRRMTEPGWWVRKLRAAHVQRIEAAAISLGYVHRGGQRYVSDVGVKRRREQKARNAAALASTVVTNQHGDEFTLAELAEKSCANPRVRRAELMTRIRGFELVADGLGHVAEFVTVTAPSRYHAIKVDGSRNRKYGGARPNETQKELVKRWSRCRTALARAGISLYGFRICEPHHDGCPHWHMLVFLRADQVATMRATVLRYFLDEWEGDEEGAAENRCKFEEIDPARGGAVAYVSKYISKNIDGMTVHGDLLGDGVVEVAERVETWATGWRVRQFQQLGTVPVGVWRELRRLRAADGVDGVVEQGRTAADVGKNSGYGEAAPGWAAYVVLQGGPSVARVDLAMRVERTEKGEKMDPETGECTPASNCYGEPCERTVWGVRDVREGRVFLSRRFKWDVRRGAKEGSGVAPERAPRTRVNNCTGGSDELDRSSGGLLRQRGNSTACGADLGKSSGGAGAGRDAKGIRQRGGCIPGDRTAAVGAGIGSGADEGGRKQ